MPPTFNLLTQRWIPCQFAGEATPRELSLRDTLVRAHEIAGIVADSPLETIALHRLLLAVLHRNFAVVDEESWSELWQRGAFDAARLDAWAKEWSHRFDLFDAEHPFYQTPGLPDTSTSAAKLGHEFSVGNNAVLFDHRWDLSQPVVPAAKAARLLLAHHLFAVGGLIGKLPGDSTGSEASHMTKAAILLTVGANLFETLLLNMVAVEGERGAPFAFKTSDDLPAWERPPARAAARGPDGYLDLLTWQTRRVLLFPNEDGKSVSRISLMAGYRFPPGTAIRQYETMAAYRVRQNPAKGQEPWAPVGFIPEKALWRDSAGLLQAVAGTRQLPATLTWLTQLRRARVIDRSRTFNLAAFGLSSDRAKVFLWRTEELPLPVAYLEDAQLVATLGQGVAAAEGAAGALRGGVRRLASEALGPGNTADKDRVTALVESLAPLRAYWPALDVSFRRYMVRLPTDYAAGQGEAASAEWADRVQEAAVAAFERACRALETESRGYRAAAEATPLFRGLLAKALAPIRPEEPAAPTETAPELEEVPV